MGKTFLPNYNNIVLKNQKIRIRKAASKQITEKRQLKRPNSTETDCELPLKKIKTCSEDSSKPDFECKQGTTEFLDDSELVLKNGSSFYLQIKDSEKGDIFFDDELKTTYFKNHQTDFYFKIIEEISLEGLDGITCECLWKRLSCIENPMLLNENIKEIIWKIICQNTDFKFYKLPVSRGELKILNHFEHIDSVGVTLEMIPQEQEVYPVEILNIPNVQGSCSTYHSRIDISAFVRDKSFKEVHKKYGNQLVIVASSKLRRMALMEDADPLLELQNVEYCLLERIGRARKLGVITQGNMSLGNQFQMDAKSVFHYRKQMLKYGLIEKQFFYIRSATTEQNKTGRLIHLRKFFKKVKSKQLLFMEQIVNILKCQPNYRMPSLLLKKHFMEYEQATKITKSSGFRRFIKYDCIYPYRTIYPNADRYEYMRKNPLKGEKGIRCYELIDPHINVIANYRNEEDIDSDDDEDEEGEEEFGGNKIYNLELFREIYLHILSKGREGCTAKDICKIVSVDRNSIRMSLKKLVSKNVIHIRRLDVGKQRMLTYYPKYLDYDEDPVVFNTFSFSKCCSVKKNLKQRQQAAIKRQRQEINENKSTSLMEVVEKNEKKKVDQNIQMFKFGYFIKNILDFSDPLESNNFDVSSILPTNILRLKLLHICISEQDLLVLNIDLQSSENTPRPMFAFSGNCLIKDKKNINYVSKLLLLKAMFNEINLENLNSVTRTRKIPAKLFLTSQENDQSSKKVGSIEVMGSNPVVAYASSEDQIDVKLMVSTPPEKYSFEEKFIKPSDMSDRVASRIQIILDVVYKNKIFEDKFRLSKVIVEKELQEGYQNKIDRKSLARILMRLVQDGYIRIYNLIVTDGKITKSQFFVCHPSITYTDSTFETATQQIKFRYFIQKKGMKVALPINEIPMKCETAGAPSPFKEIDVMESITQINDVKRDTEEASPPSLKFIKSVAKIRGLKPKFIRMRIVHELLFFLIYDYSASGEALTKSEVSDLFKSHYINLSDDDIQAMPNIYFKELSWKMFIPPLPLHKGWSHGWALMCDVILRMPISVFCKVHSITVKSPELEELLNHPIKRFHLLKDISHSVRNAIFFRRKYLGSLFDSLNRLAFCGLVQMGPQKYKEKDQSFIYLNRRATLLDTKTSEPGYNKISKQDYPVLKFYFNSVNDLDQYWYQMYFISLNTKLNQRRAGMLITYTDVSAKPDLMRALEFRTDEEAKLRDNGQLPGDNKGAAGLDSALWVHIARNWFWASVKRKESKTPALLGLEREKLKVCSDPISFKDLQIKSSSNKIYLLNTVRTDTNKQKDCKVLVYSVPGKTSKKQQKFVKTIPKRISVKKEYNDNIDRMIVKRNGENTKVKWSKREDHCLMLCKVGDLFLNPNRLNKQQIFYNIIRDVLHRMCPASKNKTSRACQRRIKILLRQKYRNISESVNNLLKMDEISKYFLPLIDMLTERKIKIKDKECRIAFVFLMHYVFQHENDVIEVLKGSMVDHLSPRNLLYTENNLLEDVGPPKFMDPLNEDDIKKDVLKTVIHSTLTSKNQPDWALQLFRIYQKYQDELIRSAVDELKATQTMSCKKFDVKKNRISWQIPFKLSQSYIYFQFTTFNKTTALEAYKTFLAIKENTINNKLDFSKDVVESKKYGQLLGISEFYSFWEKIQFNIELPQYTISLDPNIKDHSELIHALALRMRLRLKKVVQETNAEEDQEEQDIDNEQFSSRDEQDFEDNQSVNLSKNIPTVVQPESVDDIQNNPLDDTATTETIDQLKNWVTTCMERDRSPSPDFIRSQSTSEEEVDIKGNSETDHTQLPNQNVHDIESSHQITCGKTYPQGYIPTLDEIKEEMLRPPVANEDRIVPYITELSDLLNKENFTELKTDEKTLEELNSHFITQYPVLDSLSLEERDHLQDSCLLDYFQAHSKNENILKNIQRDMMIGEPPGIDDDIISQLILKNEGTHEDLMLCNRIIQYVLEKEVCGATSTDLRDRFSREETNLALTTILKILVHTKILIRVGICTLAFVHYKHQLSWLVETFHLTSEEHANIKYQENEMESVQMQLSQKKLIRIKVAPWAQINGTINYQTLNSWLSSILSHCIEYPKITLTKLCEKFCYLKPVDVFTLLEILEEMGCVDLIVYQQSKPTLFSSWKPPERRNANFLDDFKNIVIDPNSASMTLLGSFLYDSLDKCKI